MKLSVGMVVSVVHRMVGIKKKKKKMRAGYGEVGRRRVSPDDGENVGCFENGKHI